MKVLVTGAAGFIGSSVARRLAETGRCQVLGLDNLDAYYDPALKRARLDQLATLERFRFLQLDFAEEAKFAGVVREFRPDYVAHLGAQAGVRYSLENPSAYVHSNLVGFASVLEACRHTPPKRLVYASSSSVYGIGTPSPFREDAPTTQPASFYAATKQSNEVMAESYARLHGLPVTGLRLFSVYGPWGRPDMAPTLFSRAICAGKPLPLFNEGKNLRDFTYIDDIVDGILKAMLYPGPTGPGYGMALSEAEGQQGSPDPSTPLRVRPVGDTHGRIFNLGHNRPIETVLFVRMLEQLLGKKAQIELLPAQPGDMFETCADLTRVHAALGYAPKVPLETGLQRFVTWFREYYKV